MAIVSVGVRTVMLMVVVLLCLQFEKHRNDTEGFH